MKQYRIIQNGFTLEDIAGYGDNAKDVSLQRKDIMKKVFPNCKIQEREVSKWIDLQ